MTTKRKPKKSRKIPLSSKLIGLVKKVAQTPTVAGGSASVINILPQQTQRRRAPARKQEDIKKAVIQPQVIPQIITQQSRDSSSLYDTAFKSAITKLLEQKLTQPIPTPVPISVPVPALIPAPAPIPEVKKEEPKKEEIKPKKKIKIVNDENNNLLPELKKGNIKMEDILKKQEQPKLQEVEQVQEQEAGPSMPIIREEEIKEIKLQTPTGLPLGSGPMDSLINYTGQFPLTQASKALYKSIERGLGDNKRGIINVNGNEFLVEEDKIKNKKSYIIRKL
jgi:hypothetical protein